MHYKLNVKVHTTVDSIYSSRFCGGGSNRTWLTMIDLGPVIVLSNMAGLTVDMIHRGLSFRAGFTDISILDVARQAICIGCH